MDDPQKLAIYALGPVQVFRGEQLLTDWAYLDASELLYYLLQYTRKPSRKHGTEPLRAEDLHGKTREQIGLELWPNASPEQLKNTLKARLYDLRRVLGDPDWVIFDNGQYKFNATRAYTFDVERFEEQVAEAERRQAIEPANAIACLQAAVQLYRGDYLADLRQRRVRKEKRFDDDGDGAGREWYLAHQDALLAVYQRALHKLAELLYRAQNFEQAAETYKLAAAKDDYDDGAHHGLMLCLGLQGKRSQALEQYRRLVKRRGDTPPGPEIVALAARIKRFEELAPRPLAPAPAQRHLAPEQAPETSAPFQVPTDLPRFVGRLPELEAFRAALSAAAGPERARPYCLAGMGGIGKTSLAVHIAHSLRDQFPDGVLWGHVSTSEPLAILDSWARAYQCDYSGLPDLESRAAALRALLADKTVLIILDDVWDAARARALLVGGPAATVLLTGRDMDVAQALDAQIVALPVFAADESHQLLARIVGQARMMAEAPAADDICQLLGHLPLALDIAARRLASRPRWTLREMVERIRAQQRRLAELKIGDREVRASFAISWEVLDERLRGVFAALGVFHGRALSAAALAAVASLGVPAASEDLDALVALSLLSFENSIHYRQHPLLADFAREHLDEAEAADARMAKYFLAYATEHRQNYLALEQEWDNLSAGIEVAGQQAMWQVIVDYGDVLTNAWFARGRFSEARQAFALVCAAARELEEQDSYIAATINWGRACYEQGDYEEAKERLQHALQTSREVNDQHSMASVQFHLGRLALEQSDNDGGKKLFIDSQGIFEKLGDRASVGETLIQQAKIEYRFYNYGEVERLGNQALGILRTTDRHQQTLEALRYLALATGHQGQHALADQYCQQALKLCEDLQYQAELPSVLYTWMQLCMSRGDFELARQHGERSCVLFNAIGKRKSQAFVLGALITVYQELQTYDLAEDRGKLCLTILQDMRDDWNVIYVMRDLGILFARIDRATEARITWSEAWRKAEELHHPLSQELKGLLDQP
jgi:DNA-binding SARP family transcriptional activator